MPCIVGPEQPFVFHLVFNTESWDKRQEIAFFLQIGLRLQDPVRIPGSCMLVEGEELDVIGGLVWEPEVELGQVATHSFRLQASAGSALTAQGRPGIEITRCEIEYGSGKNWLRIVQPTKWPLEVLPRDGGPTARLEVAIDTTTFDREACDGRLLYARIHLYDFLNRPKTCEVRARLKRRKGLNQYLVIDWGTTNTCAAFRSAATHRPVGVKFHADQPSLELFPSDVYFRDVHTDPDNPVFLLGYEATQQAQINPECCLRSLKRRFQFEEIVYVRDEAGRAHRYPIERLVGLILLRLVAVAEETLHQEIYQIGLTFPTKWPPRVRAKLVRVAAALQARLQEVRAGVTVEVLPPDVDEANAVALHLVTCGGIADLPPHFHLIAYDFGGGTVDTSVLEVRFVDGRLATRHVGIGGRGDLGGDDVTRAVMLLLEQRLTAAFRVHKPKLALDGQAPQPVTFREILSLRNGADPGELDGHVYRVARQNWDTLWRVAEAIKIELCQNASALDGPAPLAVPVDNLAAVPSFWLKTAEVELQDALARAAPLADEGGGLPVAVLPQDPVRKALSPVAGTVVCTVMRGEGKGQATVSLDQLLRNYTHGEREGFYQTLRFSLEAVYDLEPTGDLAFKLRERVEDTVHELHWQCKIRQIEPNYIVLAGGASRLPLVPQLFKKYFGGDGGTAPAMISDHAFSKQRVAHGLASYLFMCPPRQHEDGLSRSVEVVHHPLGLLDLSWKGGLVREFRTIVPTGARIDDPGTWHPFTFTLPAGKSLLDLVWQARHDDQQPFGVVDFAKPIPRVRGQEHCKAEALPAEKAGYKGELRLRGPTRLEVRVTLGDQQYGPYLVQITTPDPQGALQG